MISTRSCNLSLAHSQMQSTIIHARGEPPVDCLGGWQAASCHIYPKDLVSSLFAWGMNHCYIHLSSLFRSFVWTINDHCWTVFYLSNPRLTQSLHGTMQPLTIVVAVVALIGFAILFILNALRAAHPWKNKTTEPPGPALIPWVCQSIKALRSILTISTDWQNS